MDVNATQVLSQWKSSEFGEGPKSYVLLFVWNIEYFVIEKQDSMPWNVEGQGTGVPNPEYQNPESNLLEIAS